MPSLDLGPAFGPKSPEPPKLSKNEIRMLFVAPIIAIVVFLLVFWVSGKDDYRCSDKLSAEYAAEKYIWDRAEKLEKKYPSRSQYYNFKDSDTKEFCGIYTVHLSGDLDECYSSGQYIPEPSSFSYYHFHSTVVLNQFGRILSYTENRKLYKYSGQNQVIYYDEDGNIIPEQSIGIS